MHFVLTMRNFIIYGIFTMSDRIRLGLLFIIDLMIISIQPLLMGLMSRQRERAREERGIVGRLADQLSVQSIVP